MARRKAKTGELIIQWSKKDKCLGALWGDDAGHNGKDAHMTFNRWEKDVEYKKYDGSGGVGIIKSFLKELEERGYDLSTLQFSIMKKTS